VCITASSAAIAIVVRMRIILASFSFLVAFFFISMPTYWILVNRQFDPMHLARMIHMNGWRGYMVFVGFPAVSLVFLLAGIAILEKPSDDKSS
jgi:hypothetical protein